MPAGTGFSTGFAGALTAGTGFSAGFSETALSGTGRSAAGMTAIPPDAGLFMVEWTTITAIEIKPDTAIKTPASITARTASEAAGFFRLLTPLRGLFPADFGAFFVIFGFAGLSGDFFVFFMRIKTRLSARRSLFYLSADRRPDYTKNQQPRPKGTRYVVLVRYLSQGTYPL
jgi:hypothetical protein